MSKRRHKSNCKYYEKETQKCNNPKCSKSICVTSANCSCYKEREILNNAKKTDEEELFLLKPYQEGIHESNNMYIGVSRRIGTPMHVGYMKSNDDRRHKARCIFYDKTRNYCKYYYHKCIGSSICNKYEEQRE